MINDNDYNPASYITKGACQYPTEPKRPSNLTAFSCNKTPPHFARSGKLVDSGPSTSHPPRQPTSHGQPVVARPKRAWCSYLPGGASSHFSPLAMVFYGQDLRPKVGGASLIFLYHTPQPVRLRLRGNKSPSPLRVWGAPFGLTPPWCPRCGIGG